MRFGFYPRLALDGIRKNKRMVLPFILTCIGIIMMTYIISYIEYSPVIKNNIFGGEFLQVIMGLGVVVIIFFAALFLFYTNSFLIKRRKKEFGLYNILGMGKGNISKILFWETLFIALISLIFGLLFGIAFSKLVELGIINMLKGEVTYSFFIPIEAISITVISYIVIFVLIYLNGLRQIWFSNAISLLKSENTGEKPPKANYLVGISGILILIVAYYLAISVKDPVSSIFIFMVAVIMVILATYLIMISGSVLLCKILQKNKKYYYKSNHFVSLSSMVYRMKRNGAGLASICILATMVLVMISSTSALFIGGEDVIRKRYPRDINIKFRMYEDAEVSKEDQELFIDTIDEVFLKHNAYKENIIKYNSIATAGLLTEGGEVIIDSSTYDDLDIDTFSDVHQIYIVSIEDYNTMMDKNEILNDDEVLIYAVRKTFNYDTFNFEGQQQYKVKEIIDECFQTPDMAMDIVPSIMIITNDMNKMAKGLLKIKIDINEEEFVTNFASNKWYYCFDTSLSNEEDISFVEEVADALRDMKLNGNDTFSYDIEGREYARRDFYSLYGDYFILV